MKRIVSKEIKKKSTVRKERKLKRQKEIQKAGDLKNGRKRKRRKKEEINRWIKKTKNT